MSMEDSWVFDSLVCFLHGPVWNAPLQTFIEEKSLVFDPNTEPDANSPEIKQLHDEYKNLVDFMLGSFMDEMQITPEQFELACAGGRQQLGDNPFQFHSNLFQQIWAANDIKIFVRMMTQRNVELQLQALDLIEKNQLVLFQDDELREKATQNESSNSACNSMSASLPDMESMKDVIAKSLEHGTPDAALTPETDNILEENSVVDKFERLNLFFEKQNNAVDPVEVMTRQEYLRQQRDKIVEIKKKNRAKQLMETVARKSFTTTPAGRPSSAQIAQTLMESNSKSSEQLFDLNRSDSEVNPALELRRTLAKRLRMEVVEPK